MLEREKQVIECWPENKLALSIMSRLMTQWIVAFNNVVGLRYESVLAVMDIRGVEQSLRSKLLDDLQIMEYEMLEVINNAK